MIEKAQVMNLDDKSVTTSSLPFVEDIDCLHIWWIPITGHVTLASLFLCRFSCVYFLLLISLLETCSRVSIYLEAVHCLSYYLLLYLNVVMTTKANGTVCLWKSWFFAKPGHIVSNFHCEVAFVTYTVIHKIRSFHALSLYIPWNPYHVNVRQ